MPQAMTLEHSAPAGRPVSLRVEWSVVIFARNEAARIAECIASARQAMRGKTAHITIIINGSSDNSIEIARAQASQTDATLAIYKIPFGCKSNAINAFIHQIRPAAQVYFFVDAAVFVDVDAFRHMAQALCDQPEPMAVSGLPVNGRSARKMREDAKEGPRLFGGMFAVRADFLDHLCRLGRRLPIGLYRGDGLFSGYLCHETNGVAHRRLEPRIATVPEAHWRIRPISFASPADIRRGFNRLVRQARGRLENQSWNTILWTDGFGALPRFADVMIHDWLATGRPNTTGLAGRFFTWLAIRQVRRWRPPTEAELAPIRVR